MVSADGHYFIWCRRYKCSAAAHEKPYTFLGYDPEVVALLPDFIRYQFPVLLTRKLAIDLKAVDVFRRLRQTGYTFEKQAALLNEISARRYYQRYRLYLAHVDAYNRMLLQPLEEPHKDPTKWTLTRVGQCSVLPSCRRHIYV